MSRRKLLVGMAVSSVIAATAGIALAVPGDGGAIQGCYQKNNGQLRVVDAATDCRSSESSLSWSQTGPAGADATIAPHEESRVLTLPTGDNSGIFGGKACDTGTLVSGGFQLLRNDVKVNESFIGPGFGLPRVYIVNVTSISGSNLTAGDVVKMWVTCV